jgi:uncharacterized protein (UPF0333 family)
MKILRVIFVVLLSVAIVGTYVCFAEIAVWNVDVPEKVYTLTWNQDFGIVNVSVTVKNTGEVGQFDVPIQVNGERKAVIKVTLGKNETKQVNTLLRLDSGREKIVNPFSPPLTYINYDISAGEYLPPQIKIHVTVSVYAFPDWSYWAIVFDVASVVVTLLFFRWVSKS